MSQFEKVDAFGRAIRSTDTRKDQSDSHDRTPRDRSRDRSNSRERRGRSPLNSKRFPEWKHPGHNRGGQMNSRGQDFQGRRYYGNKDGGRNFASRRSFDGEYPPKDLDGNSSLAQANQPQKAQPMMSFNFFMMSQNEDLPLDVFQKKYAAYTLEYLTYFSDYFFKASMSEEWFQDRYNPINIQATEKESNDWAVSQSAVFRAEALEQTEEFIRAISLEPLTPKPKSGEDDATATTSQVSGKYLPGHESRTVYVSGIHACCPKSVFKAAIVRILAGENPEAPVYTAERILVAQPLWNSRNLDRFDRAAWIVMPTTADAAAVATLLKEQEIHVPCPPSPETGISAVAFSFKIQATIHISKLTHTVPDFFSQATRVRSDTLRAIHVAQLLDELRDIPQENKLHSILMESNLNEAVKRPIDLLDVAISYLRRVHLVSFYSGKRYRDEAHLLSMASGNIYRSKAFQSDHVVSSYSVTEILAELDSKKESGAILKEEEEGQETGDTKKAETEVTEETNQVKTSSATILEYLVTDRKIGPMVADINLRLKFKRAKENDANAAGMADEEEAKALEAAIDKILDELVRETCKFELEDKCRCCYTYCNKLFKGIAFLTKHLRTKHNAEFGLDILLREAEPFMRKRFEDEDLGFRPLPPVEVDSQVGIELKSVKELLDRYVNITVLPPPPLHPPHHSYQNNNYRNGGRVSFGGGRDRDFNRDSDRDNHFPQNNKRGRYDNDSYNDSNTRRFSSENNQRNSFGGEGGGGRPSLPAPEQNLNLPRYMDIDAPKETVTGINYGVAILPTKKRKLSAKPKLSLEGDTVAAVSAAVASSDGVVTSDDKTVEK